MLREGEKGRGSRKGGHRPDQETEEKHAELKFRPTDGPCKEFGGLCSCPCSSVRGCSPVRGASMCVCACTEIHNLNVWLTGEFCGFANSEWVQTVQTSEYVGFGAEDKDLVRHGIMIFC